MRSVIAFAAFSAVTLATTPGFAADGLVTTHRVSAALASEAVTTAVATCSAQGYRVTAVLMTWEGVEQALLHGDGAPQFTIENAHRKAFTAVSFRADSGEIAKRDPVPAAALRLDRMNPAQGAILIKTGDEIIGALGVSGAPGGDKDEACARAGLAKIQDRLK